MLAPTMNHPTRRHRSFVSLTLGLAVLASFVARPGVAGVPQADLSIFKVDRFDPATAGFEVIYTIKVINNGPDAAAAVSWSDTLPGTTTFGGVNPPGGWSCTTPPIGAAGTVTCSIPSMPVGIAEFDLEADIPAATPAGAHLSNTVTVTSTTSDPDTDDRSATEITNVKAIANLSAHKSGAPNPVTPGTNLTYTITVHNNGPSNAADVKMNDTVPVGTTFVSLAAPAGWSCVTPAVGATGAMQCTLPTLPPPGDAAFTLVVKVNSDLPAGRQIANNGNFASTTPWDLGHGGIFSTNNTVGNGIADISLTKSDAPDPVAAGGNLTYTITAGNAGPSNAPTATLTDSVPAGTTFVSLTSPGGWSCTTPAVGAGGPVSCTHGYLPPGNHVFTLVVKVNPGASAGTVISNSASLTMLEFTDPNPGDTVATADTTVVAGGGPGPDPEPEVSVTGRMYDAGSFDVGSIVTYTVVLDNLGPGPQADNPGDEFIDVLPAGLTLLGAEATSGEAIAFVGTNTVTWNGSIPAGGSVTITITARIDAGSGAAIANAGTIAFDADGDGTNETTRSIYRVGGEALGIPVLDWRGLLALAALLGAAGAFWLRRR